MKRSIYFGLGLSLFFAASITQAAAPIIREGPTCPAGYYRSGVYCLPSSQDSTRDALVRSGPTCPAGFYRSGSYCLRGGDR